MSERSKIKRRTMEHQKAKTPTIFSQAKTLVVGVFAFTAKARRCKSGRLLRVGPFVNIAMILRNLDCDPEPVFTRVGFDVEQFNDPDLKLPYLQITQLKAKTPMKCSQSEG